jgi:diguanylate cyclase (GGDEF)-like protein
MEALQRVSSIVAGTLNTDESLRRIVATLADTFAFPAVAFHVLEGDGLVVSAAVGFAPESLPAAIGVGEGIVGRVATTGEPAFITDVTQEPDYLPVRNDVTSAICVPVGGGDRLVGVLHVEGTAERPLTEHDLHLLQSFAEYAGILLNNARLFEQMQTLASRDPMTDLPNQRELQLRLREEIAHADRHQRPLALLIIDLDQFKQINDQFGHLAGDELLRAIAARLSERLRQGDLLARYAGDEFVVILPETNRAAANRIAERLIEHVCERPFPLRNGVQAVIELSIGLASYPDDATTPTELIQHADDAMYRAKRSGSRQSLTSEAVSRIAVDSG